MTEQPIAVRLDVATVERLDRIAETLSKRAAGVRVNRSAAVRLAVERGIDVLESELGLSKKRKK